MVKPHTSNNTHLPATNQTPHTLNSSYSSSSLNTYTTRTSKCFRAPSRKHAKLQDVSGTATSSNSWPSWFPAQSLSETRSSPVVMPHSTMVILLHVPVLRKLRKHLLDQSQCLLELLFSWPAGFTEHAHFWWRAL